MTDAARADGVRPADPCVMVIFGAAGDLTKRKLLPSLQNMYRAGILSEQFGVVGIAVNPLTDDAFRDAMLSAVKQFGAHAVDPSKVDEFTRRLHYVAGNFSDPATYTRLKERLTEVSKEWGTHGNTLFYLATPPQFFGEIAAQLGAAGLVKEPEDPSGWTRIIIEKPFGRDLDSARELNHQVLSAFDESQVYRIDHYLGKETVQNILIFRFINGIFEPIWNRRYIDHVQLTVAESIGIEGRGAYFEKAGVLRDIMQNHMFQLLCLTAMEPPISLGGEDLRNEKVKVLHAIRPMQPEEILQQTVRGQYAAGFVDGQRVPGYREEPDVAPNSPTETYAALKLFVDNWRWADVPFYLRAGKRLARRDTEIVIEFRRAPLMFLREQMGPQQRPNRLTINVQPDERINLRFQAKSPGPSMRLAPVEMQFKCSDLEGDQIAGTGYETLLYDCMIGDPILFHRADMVEEAWKVASPILDVWQALRPRDFPNYEAGSWGPKSATELIAPNGQWVEPT